MYDIILLDLDNTILDFDSAEKDCFKKVIESMELKYTDELLLQYKKINRSLWKCLEQGKISKETVLNTRFREFFKLYDIPVDGIDIEKKYRSCLDCSSVLVPNAEYTLKALKRMGKRIYSASNGVYSTQIKRLSNAGIIHLFDGHFISDKVNHEKPSPYFFQYCLKNICEASNSSVIMVGDNPISDVQGAVNAGIHSCFYQHNKNVECSYANYIIHDISELLGIV